MGSQYTNKIKHLIENIYTVADSMDSIGVSESIPYVDPEEGMRGTIRTDVLLFIFRIIDKDKRINDECVSYLNECFGYNFSVLTVEIARKKTIDSEVPQMCILLPAFILLDKQLHGIEISSLYLETMAFVTLGFFRCQDRTSIEEMVSYYRYINTGMKMVEKALGKKVDFDPLSVVSSEHMEIIKYAVEVDELIHKDEEDPLIKAFGDTLEKIVQKDDASEKEEERACFGIVVDPGDGSDLVDEKPVDIVKDEGDGSDLPDEWIEPEELNSDALFELDELIGLKEVKQQIRTTLNAQRIRKRCEMLGIKRTPVGMHMIFTGNPGTGKTSVARILGKIYQEAGLLSKGHCVEVSRAELVGKYVGHTAVLVKEVFEKARGGILFIDEAYSLTTENDDYGQEAVETLLKLMEDNRDDIVVIAAGYPMLMQDFLESNPGLKSRFPFVIRFPDYTGDELVRIFRLFCEENEIVTDNRVLRSVRNHFEKEASRKTGNKGNAREVRNYFEKMIFNQADRLINNGTLDRDSLCKFEQADLPSNRVISEIVTGGGRVLAFHD